MCYTKTSDLSNWCGFFGHDLNALAVEHKLSFHTDEFTTVLHSTYLDCAIELFNQSLSILRPLIRNQGGAAALVADCSQVGIE